MTEETLFAAVLEQPEADRQRFLEATCEADPALLNRLQVLLAAHKRAVGILEQSAGPPAKSSSTANDNAATGDQIGTVVAGRYKLLEQIGEGGMGTVWVAEQIIPVRRKVALKLIKAGMDSKTVLSRFEAERQALALMDHPNIAKVLDGGTAESGRPFFVMEYVKGIRLTKYCDDVRLNVAERLALFVPVCQAVQHAHQKGIIHRDLKPSNILVCLYDGQPVPKIIDFGLAKAIHQPLTEHTLHTAHGIMMGTPLYMSPEQAEFNNFDVDTRTDIYSLGVILYELVTGTTPLERQRFKEAALYEMLRLIKEVEPLKPSARLSGSGFLPTIAAQRKLEPAKLTKLVRGELDWIVMKALEKERSRRYETANGFARDIQRYLADEAVEASPPSRSYLLRKFARKHRTALTTATTFLLLLLAGVAVSTWQAIRATFAEEQTAIERDKAKEQEALAKKNEQAAVDQEQEAIKQARIAKENEDKANKAVKELRYNLALDQILLSQAAFDNASVAVAHQRLEEVPVDLRNWEWHFLKRQYHGGILTLYGHIAAVNDVAYSPDGTRLATASDDMTAKIWDARTGALLLDLNGHANRVTSVAFSPDGELIVTGSKDKTAKVWNAHNGTPRLELKGHYDHVLNVAFSPDGERVLTGSRDSAKAWDARTGVLQFEFKGQTRQVENVVYSRDGTRVFCDGVKLANVWDARTGTRLLDLDWNDPNYRVSSMAYSGDGARLVLGHVLKGSAKLWDARTGMSLLELNGHVSGVSCVAFSPDGTRVVTGSRDATAKVWDTRSGASLVALKGHTDTILNVAFSPDGMQLATGSRDGTAKVWEGRNGAFQVEFKNHKANNTIMSLAFSPDGARIVCGTRDGTAQVWDAKNGKFLFEHKEHVTTYDVITDKTVASIAFSPDLTRVVSGGMNGSTRVWDVRTGASLLELKGHKHVPDVVYSADGTRIATTDYGSTRIWDSRTGDRLLEIKDASFFVTFSPDGMRLVTGWSKTPKIWDAHTGKLLIELKGHEGQLSSAMFNRDGTRLVTGCWDKTAKIWDVDTGALLCNLKGHADRVNSVAYSPDGMRVVTASSDKTVSIWDTRTGTPLLQFKTPVARIAFSPDGTRLALLGGGKVKVLDVNTQGPEERENRLFWTQPRPDLHWEEYQKAKEDKDDFAANFHLDRLLIHYQKATVLNPRDVQAHADQGEVLLEKKDIDGAIRQFRRAIDLEPKRIGAHKGLARAFAAKNDWTAASTVYRQILTIDPKDIEVAVILFLKGEHQLKDNEVRLSAIKECVLLRRYLDAARLYVNVFAAEPKLAESTSPTNGYRQAAARCAALTAADEGNGIEKLDETERARWRKQALDWLRADLAAWKKPLDDHWMDPLLMDVTMRFWLESTDLAGIRDHDALARLPAGEREECRKLWTDVEELRKTAQEQWNAMAANELKRFKDTLNKIK